MNNITVNQDALLAMVANFHGFKVEGLYVNGAMLTEARTKKERDTLEERLYRLRCSLSQLDITAEVTLVSSNNKIQVKII